MALKIIDHGSPEYQQMVKLRDVILRKPLGLGFTPEDIEKENWTDIEKLFDSRHSIIHNQHEDILSTYNKDKILGYTSKVSS